MSAAKLKTVGFSPVFNQIIEFPRVLAELRATALPCDEILLVNNGSTDGSERLVHEAGYPYVDLPRNLGVGHAISRAIDWAIEHGFDVLGGFAANGKMLPSEMHRVLDPILGGEADWVTGSRYLPGGDSPNLPGFRRWAIPMVNRAVWLSTGQRVTDATCGYRAFRVEMFRRAEFDWHAPWLHTYAFEPYCYAKVLLDGELRWKEVPITMRYPAPGARYSKIRPGMDWFDMVYPFFRARLDGKGFRPARVGPSSPTASRVSSSS